MTRAVCPGSYDPPTLGHLDIISRAAGLFDEVHVLVGTNTSKQGLFSPDERVELLAHACGELANVKPLPFDGLLVDYCRDHGIECAIKGVRAAADMDFEIQMAQMNATMTDLVTLMMPASPKWSYVSSSLVREIARFGRDISEFTTPEIAKRTAERYR
jgi:pantetheine-phosphate adenylyltransferase